MKESGATQSQVAAAAGVTQPTVSRWLEGQIPKADDLYRLAHFYNREMDWFLGGPVRTAQDPHSVEALHAMSQEARMGANALRAGAERFGRLPEMLPRIESLEREAAAIRALVEEMIASGYSPAANSVAPHVRTAADREQRNSERRIERRRTKGDKGKT